jgi:hypothetical protein
VREQREGRGRDGEDRGDDDADECVARDRRTDGARPRLDHPLLELRVGSARGNRGRTGL